MSQTDGEGDGDVVIVNEDPPRMVAHSSSRFNVKIVNPRNQGGVIVEKWETNSVHDGVHAMKTDLLEKLEGLGYATAQDNFQFGFITPGHGLKGKQQSIDIDDDVVNMYQQYQGRKEIGIYVKIKSTRQKHDKGATGRKRCLPEVDTPRDGTDGSSPSPKRVKNSDNNSAHKCGPNYQKHLNRMSEVDRIVDELEAKHRESGLYSPEQTRVWAHMLQMGKHDSYINPPSKRFFKTAKPDKHVQEGLSPSKRLNMRSECMNQIDKWHSLMERGAITTDQYKEYQDAILADMKKL